MNVGGRLNPHGRFVKKWTGLKGQAALAEEQCKNHKRMAEDLKAAWEDALKRSGFSTEEAYGEASLTYADLQAMKPEFAAAPAGSGGSETPGCGFAAATRATGGDKGDWT